MKERLIVKNFGPISDVSIIVRDVNVFIGPNSSGKSTIAKLLAIFSDTKLLSSLSYNEFNDQLVDYNICYPIQSDTIIRREFEGFYWELDGSSIKRGINSNFPLKNILGIAENLVQVNNSTNFKFSNKLNELSLSLQLLSQLDFDKLKNEFDNILSSYFDKEKIETQFRAIETYYKEFQQNDFNSIDPLMKSLQAFSSSFKNLLELYEILYIPAERILISMIGKSLFSFIGNDVSLPTFIKVFGSKFENARSELTRSNLNFNNMSYEQINSENYININGDNKKFKLEHASSGLQSAVPLILTIKNSSVKWVGPKNLTNRRNLIVIEEPELNLFPVAQRELLSFIIKNVYYQRGGRLVLTTHSPYTLSVLSLLTYAYKFSKQKPYLKKQITEIVPVSQLVNIAHVSCYSFEDGRSIDLIDYKEKTINTNMIDEVSEVISKDFEKLFNLFYNTNQN